MIEYQCQQNCLELLQAYAAADRHSILIDGPLGCGKTTCAKQYASMLGVSEFCIVQSAIQDIRDTISECYKITSPVVLCIENLDLGVVGASYALLKFLEEPISNVYIVVTCQNIYEVPDTIVSRSVVASISPPIVSDINKYAKYLDSYKFDKLSRSPLWRCISAFSDVNIIYELDANKLNYFSTLSEILDYKKSVSDIVWKLGHFEDKSATPIELVIRYIMEISKTSHVVQSGIACIKDLRSKRIASHAALARFVFELKYID